MSLLGMLLSSDEIIGDRNPLDDRWYGAGTQLSLTGIKVDQSNALKLATVWACTRILSSTIAGLPIQIMQVRKGSPVQVSDHRASMCLNMWPNNDMGSVGFRTCQLPQQINAGNSFAEIVQTPNGPQIYPIHHSRVKPARRKDDGALAWQVANDNDSPTYLMDTDVLHVRSDMTNDGIMGMGVIEHARESIGFGLALEREGAARFANAGRPEIVIEGGKFKDDEARSFYRTTWAERHQGYQHRGKPMMLPPDAKLHQLEFSAVDQQWIETGHFNVETLCRWYLVPPHLVMHLISATFSNVEHLGQSFVTYSLMAWINLWEEELNRKILGQKDVRDGYYVRFDVDALMRGDSTARASYYNTMVNQVSAMNPNQVAARENLPNVGPEGDKYRAPLNLTTLDKLGETLQKPPDGRLIKRPAPGGVEEEPEESDEEKEKGLAVSQQQDNRISIATEAARESLLDVTRVMVRQEVQAAQSAAKHPSKFLDKIEDFYGKHSARMLASLEKPVIVCDILRGSGLVNIATMLTDSIAAHCQSAKDELLAATDCQPEQLEETVGAVVRKWDTRAAAFVSSLIPN